MPSSGKKNKPSTSQSSTSKPSTSKSSPSKPSTSTGVRPRNPLDSTAPTPRGKERRNPKEKKPKSMRKQLIKEKNLLKLALPDDTLVYRDSNDTLLIVNKNELFPNSPKRIYISKSNSNPNSPSGIIFGKSDDDPNSPSGIYLCNKESDLNNPAGVKELIFAKKGSDGKSPKGIIIGKRNDDQKCSHGSVTIVGKNDGIPSTSKASFCVIGKSDKVPSSSKASVCFISKKDKAPDPKAAFCVIGKNDFIAHSSHSSVTTPDEIEPGAPRVPVIANIDPVINYEEALSKRMSEIGLVDNVEALVHYTLHSSRHREYARQALTNEIEYSVYIILLNLTRFQDRAFLKAPEKMETKRRYVCGFNQVTRYIRINKVKAVIIAPDIEQVMIDGVLDEAVEDLINLCQEKNVQLIFTASRNRLARVCSKTPRSNVSCLGIIDYSGVHEEFNKLIHFVERARDTYDKTQAQLVRYLENLPESSFTEFYEYIRVKNSLPCELQYYRQAVYSPLKRNVYSYIRLIKHAKSS